ncbi:tol-pal system protein YbgF [Lysobacter sp. D1-1-M9]|uniref:tol-pal system protein YbgF n=1 Tax=Novilysobacter longmucuonensis TaxID=3098603 RepID=UPI002FC7A543
MRSFAVSLAVAAALVAAAPASAQRRSLAARVALLAQRAGDTQANIDLQRQVNLLQAEVQARRAQVEDLTHQQEQLRQTARAQYLDLDGRLNRIESGAAAPMNPDLPIAPPAGAAPIEGGQAVDARTDQAADAKTVPTPDPAPSVYGDAGTLAQGAGEREAYDAAFDALKAGEYAESANLFQSFLDQYPSGSYAPNALYWLGESYYVTQNYQAAQQQFQTLLERYPTHDKAAGAMLKVGLSQYGLQQLDAAERTLSEVSRRYPGSDAARTAEDRLGAIQLNRLR